MDKAGLRKAMRLRRGTLTAEAAREWSRAAQEAVLADAAWRGASCVALYAAVRGEADTTLLLADAWERGKRVLLPRVAAGVAGMMDFVPCEQGQALETGCFGIPQPCGTMRAETLQIPDLVIVPGVAFDREGRRVGSGGGYYDRMLGRPDMRDAVRIGLAYAFQLVDRIPAEAWDAPMHALATEEGLAWI